MFKTTKIRVGTSLYTVEACGANILQGKAGLTDGNAKTIKLNTETNVHKHANEILDTLIHETLHTIFMERDLENTLNISYELHEKIVTQLAIGLTGVIVDNPPLMKDINSLAAKTRKALDI